MHKISMWYIRILSFFTLIIAAICTTCSAFDDNSLAHGQCVFMVVGRYESDDKAEGTQTSSVGAPRYDPISSTISLNERNCDSANSPQVANHTNQNSQATCADNAFLATLRAIQLRGGCQDLQKMKKRLIAQQRSWKDVLKFKWRAYAERKRKLQQIDAILSDKLIRMLRDIRQGNLETARQTFENYKRTLETSVMKPGPGFLLQPNLPEGAEVQIYKLPCDCDEFKAAQTLLESRTDYQEYMRLLAAQCEQVEQVETVMYDLNTQSVQMRVVEALQECHTPSDLADRFEYLTDAVFERSISYNCGISPELEDLVRSSIGTIRVTQDAPTVIFHTACVEQILSDVQVYVMPDTLQQPTLFERSPQLLARALEKFVSGLNPVTQVKHAVEFWVGTARFVADVTAGWYYLTPEQYQQRIDGFWQTLEALSPSNLAQLTAEQWVDMAAQMAADFVYAKGVAGTLAYLKEIDAVGKAQRKVSCIADKFKKGFDQVLGKEPILVTPEGITWKASQEFTALHMSVGEVKGGVKEVIKDTNEILNQERRLVEKVTRMTSVQARAAAEKLGFKKTNFYSSNQPIFKKGNRYITPDIDSHCGGVWKMADSVENLKGKARRMGTYDAFLNRIGD